LTKNKKPPDLTRDAWWAQSEYKDTRLTDYILPGIHPFPVPPRTRTKDKLNVIDSIGVNFQAKDPVWETVTSRQPTILRKLSIFGEHSTKRFVAVVESQLALLLRYVIIPSPYLDAESSGGFFGLLLEIITEPSRHVQMA